MLTIGSIFSLLKDSSFGCGSTTVGKYDAGLCPVMLLKCKAELKIERDLWKMHN